MNAAFGIESLPRVLTDISLLCGFFLLLLIFFLTFLVSAGVLVVPSIVYLLPSGMNTSDPFELRRISPLSLLQLRTATSVSESATVTINPIEAPSASSESPDLSADAMSFSVPKQVPTFQAAQRQLEDTVWGNSRAAQQRIGFINDTVGRKIGSYFNEDELPMYKDKPYSHGSSGRNAPFWRRKRTLAGGVIFFFGLLYALGLFSSKSTRYEGGRKTTWDWITKGDSNVDWTTRRERVKEAFIVSWDAYSEHGWGK
jgi:mannosyl-oligosaccharide alpha-1,2-mannosidase